jgi:hypothetical protein
MKLLSLLLCLFCIVQVQAQKNTQVRTLNPQKCQNIKIKVPNNLIKHEAWEFGGIRIDIVIEAGIPPEVIDALKESGRYELDGKLIDADYFVDAPNLEVPLKLNGKAFNEKVEIRISTPDYFVMNDQSSLYKDIDEDMVRARSVSEQEMQQLLQKMRAIREDVNVHMTFISTVSEADTKKPYKFELNGKFYTASELNFSSAK